MYNGRFQLLTSVCGNRASRCCPSRVGASLAIGIEGRWIPGACSQSPIYELRWLACIGNASVVGAEIVPVREALSLPRRNNPCI